MKSYRELRRLRTIEDRFEYLKLNGCVGEETFGFNRYLNQYFYSTDEWKKIRDKAIIRDNGNDLGIEGFEISGFIVVHHIVPVTKDDILERRDIVLSLDNVICCSGRTHRAIHYGDVSLLPKVPIERRPGDTTPWLR